MLEVASLRKTFDGERQHRGRKGSAETGGRVFAVNDVSFVVEEGDLVTLLGPIAATSDWPSRTIEALYPMAASSRTRSSPPCSPGSDAKVTTIRHAAIQLDTPDELRGVVTAIYQMSSRGGLALGDTLVGGVAGVIGPVAALTAEGLATAAIAAGVLSRPNAVRSYPAATQEAAHV
jgi:hypothetical protein